MIEQMARSSNFNVFFVKEKKEEKSNHYDSMKHEGGKAGFKGMATKNAQHF